MNSKEYIEIEEQYGAHNYHPLDVVIERGEGVWVYDVEWQKVPGLPERIFSIQSGTCPSPHPEDIDRTGKKSHPHLPRLPQ